MSRSTQTFLIGAALLGLGSQIHAQANDVDCFHCVDTRDIDSEAITTNKIEPKAVTTKKLASQAVTTYKLAGGAVTTSKIKNGAVTASKLSPQISNAVSAPVYVVLDSTGAQVGDPVIFANREYANIPLSVQLSTGETLEFIARVTAHGINASSSIPVNYDGIPSQIYFAQLDCVGQGYVPDWDNNIYGLIAPAPRMALVVNNLASPGTSPAEVWRTTSNTNEDITAFSYNGVDANGDVICSNYPEPEGRLQRDVYPGEFDQDLHQLYIPPFSLQRIN